MEPFNSINETDEAVEARGHKWLVYWSIREDDLSCFMSNGSSGIEVVNPHEWQDLYAEAGRLTGDELTACDLACERLRWLLQRR